MSYQVLIASLLLLPLTAARGCHGKKLEDRLVPPHQTLQLTMSDGVELWADVYRVPEPQDVAAIGGKPVLLCMHMTGRSRGEYKRLAAEMMALGTHVMSVDLRCGGPGENVDRKTGYQWGIMNETWKQAREMLGRQPTYIESYPDVVAAVAWARELFPYSRIALVGSSFSASLALVYGAQHPENIDAVAALSPGEYMPPWSVGAMIHGLEVPSYVTCGNTAADMNHAQPVANAILDQERVHTFWPEETGYVGNHGSWTLLGGSSANHKKQWDEFRYGIRAAFRPLQEHELAARRLAAGLR